jgi:hypothetical protein
VKIAAAVIAAELFGVVGVAVAAAVVTIGQVSAVSFLAAHPPPRDPDATPVEVAPSPVSGEPPTRPDG